MTLSDYLRTLKRRRTVVLLTALLVPAVAVALSFTQPNRYAANAQILLNGHNLALTLNGTSNPDAGQDPNRLAETQAKVARVPLVASRVLAAVPGTGYTVDDFLRHSSATTSSTANVLALRVTDAKRRTAIRLVNSYARQFTAFSRQLDAAAFLRAESSVAARLEHLRAAGGRSSALYTSLVEKDDELRTMAALGTENVVVLASAVKTHRVQPRPLRNGVLGAFFGVLLGLLLAFVFDALDTKLTGAEEIERELQLPLLARVPRPPRQLRRDRQRDLVMIHDPYGPAAESYRMLRSNLEFTSVDQDVRTIVVTSALELEGKTTTAANLAVAFASTGRSVVLVDLDLRRPSLAELFGVHPATGLTDVIRGRGSMTVEAALVPIPVSSDAVEATPLHLLPAGALPPAPGEFVATRAVGELLQDLREWKDLILIDTPPVLHVGDALTISRHADAILVVSRLDLARRPSVREFRRSLASTPTPVSGFVLAGARRVDFKPYDGYRGRRPVADSTFFGSRKSS